MGAVGHGVKLKLHDAHTSTLDPEKDASPGQETPPEEQSRGNRALLPYLQRRAGGLPPDLLERWKESHGGCKWSAETAKATEDADDLRTTMRSFGRYRVLEGGDHGVADGVRDRHLLRADVRPVGGEARLRQSAHNRT